MLSVNEYEINQMLNLLMNENHIENVIVSSSDEKITHAMLLHIFLDFLFQESSAAQLTLHTSYYYPLVMS